MANLTTLTLAHLPPHILILASLFTSVTNSAEIRAQLLASNHDYDYAFIDATTLVSTTHILTAIFRAVNDWMAGRLKTRNVHSEVVFSLGPNNNIADTLRRFGISDKTTSLLAMKIIDTSSSSPSATTQTPETIQTFVTSSISGSSLPFSDASLQPLSDVALIRKLYKLPLANSSKKGGGQQKSGGAVNGHAGQNEEGERKELEVQILGIMAVKGS